MSETTATEALVTDEAPVEIPPLARPFMDALAILATEANEARSAYKSATDKPDESWKAIAEANAEHPAVKAFLEYEAKVEEQIKKLQAAKKENRAKTIANVTGEQVTSVSDEDAKALKETFLAAKKKYAATKQNILLLLDGDETALQSYIKALGIVEVNNLGGGQAKAGSGEIVRLRISDAWVDGNPVQDTKGKVSFTTLSTHLKVDADVLRDAAAKAGNVDSVRDLPKGQDVSFTINVGEGDEAKTHEVVIRPAVPAKAAE